MTRWLRRILVWLDQGLNTVGGPVFNLLHHGRWDGPWGDPDETISSVLGKIRLWEGGEIPWWPHPVEALLSRLLDAIDRRHTEQAIERDEGWWP